MDKKIGKYILLYKYSDMENSISYEENPSRNVKLGLQNFKIFGSLLSEILILNGIYPSDDEVTDEYILAYF